MIGITAGLLTTEIPKTITNERFHLSTDYVSAVVQAGAVPVILPILQSQNAEVVCANLDGLILSGGNDVDARFSDPAFSPEMLFEETTNPCSYLGRDLYEMALCREMLKREKPIMGICRGVQVLNVVLGGTLHQEVDPTGGRKHIQANDPHKASHKVYLERNGLLAQIFQKEELAVNSFHHQAIASLGEGMVVSAESEDGWIEGATYTKAKCVFGVQWHPEIMAATNQDMAKLFRYFIAQTK